jgi:glucoside 3-dehydrogenase (cytochrome c) hitch-hiker subunit
LQRRDLLRLLGVIAATPALAGLTPGQLLALGRETHARLDAGGPSGLAPAAEETIALLAELILPETDTPGARSAGVPAFIYQMMAEWQTEAERQGVLDGLDDLDRRSRQAGGASFVGLTAEEQASLLQSIDGTRGDAGTAEYAWSTIKDLAVYGYFTSEIVQTRVLQVKIIPGRFDGCIPIHADPGAAG